MKIWVDDIRIAPKSFVWCKTVNDFKSIVKDAIKREEKIELVSLDHDAGDFFKYGGDYIECVKWLEELKYTEGLEPCKFFYLHTGNPVGRDNMWKIIRACGWQFDEHPEDF